MRIGVSTSVIQRGRTGIAQYLFALLRAFMRCGREHRFVLFVLEEDLPLFEFARPMMEIVPVPERYRSAVKNILWHQTQLPKLAREHCLDVLHIPSYRRMLWRCPCPRVTTIHDLAPFWVPNKYDWKRMLYGRVIEPRIATRQEEIIAISASTAADIERFLAVPRERIHVIHNGLDHTRFSPVGAIDPKAEAARRYHLHRPFFLYVARLEHPGKNHVRLIAAFNHFKASTRSDWQLVFGGSDWHGVQAIHAAAAESPFKDDIRFLSFVSDEALPDLYRAADAFVYPSLFEGFGLPPIEAMACGTPVICSPRGSLREVVGNAATIVDPEDAQSIASGLMSVACDPSVRERLRAAGFEQSKKFDWHHTAVATLGVYQQAAARLRSAHSGAGSGNRSISATHGQGEGASRPATAFE
jgi:glycosyltransferase involved in cell wall biosynthesis